MTTRLALRLVFLAFGLMFWAAAHYYGKRPHDTDQSTTSQSNAAQLNPGRLFVGDMYATMPQNETQPSTYAEDQERAKSAATCVRVVFEPESQPQFADLVKSALQKLWNPNLGYRLVFGESQGPLEDAATAVTYRMTVQTDSQEYAGSFQPYQKLLFSSVDLTVHSSLSAKIQNRFPSHSGSVALNPVPTSWDNLTCSCEAPLPGSFSYHADELEPLNRRQLGSLYRDFRIKLYYKIPAFRFFPDRDFDRIRDLYIWPKLNGTNPPVDPLEFAQVAKELVSKYHDYPADPNRYCLDAICVHLLDAGATNYIAGISTVLGGWLPVLSEDHRQLLVTYISFANYELMKTLINQRDGSTILESMPEVWDDPGLAYWVRGYVRRNSNSPQLNWLATRFADKLNSAPVFSSSQTVVGQPKHQPVIIITPPSSASTRTNHHVASRQLISSGTATAHTFAGGNR